MALISLDKGYDLIGLDKKGRKGVSKIVSKAIKRETKKFNK